MSENRRPHALDRSAATPPAPAETSASLRPCEVAASCDVLGCPLAVGNNQVSLQLQRLRRFADISVGMRRGLDYSGLE